MTQKKSALITEKQAYLVVVPFPWRKGHWTEEEQELHLLPCEAKALLLSGRIKHKPAAKTTPKASK